MNWVGPHSDRDSVDILRLPGLGLSFAEGPVLGSGELGELRLELAY